MKTEKKPVVAVVVHDDVYALAECLAAAKAVGAVFVFVSRVAWRGPSGDWHGALRIARAAGASVSVGSWKSEAEHRGAAIAALRAAGHHFVVLLDSDEVVPVETAQTLVSLATHGLAARVYGQYISHWKGSDYAIEPAEPYRPLLMADVQACTYEGRRECSGGSSISGEGSGFRIHHLSYCGSDQRIALKLERWRHDQPVVRGWFGKVWQAWNGMPYMQGLHPTTPNAYWRAKPVEPSENLKRLRAEAPEKVEPSVLTGVSVVIPLYGGEDDIRQCLASLEPYHHDLQEVIVVDNCSPDRAGAIVEESFPWVHLVKQDKNGGFASGCNAGLRIASGQTVLFLNSDTVVPLRGLSELMLALAASPHIGAAGPLSNYAGYGQRIDVSYDSLAHLDRFADAISNHERPNIPTDMLVGFCLAVKRSVLDEVGGFDEDFGLGLWEDNDLCYRILRANYKLVIASRAFIHHHGSRSLARLGSGQDGLYEANQQRFIAKWKGDLESDFASGLPGLASGKIQFKRTDQSNGGSNDSKLATALCCTYGRPHLLEEAIASFQAQDYEPKELVILNDLVDQPLSLSIEDDRIRIYNTNERFSSLGAKRNACMALARGAYLFVWDDDDLQLPWRMSESIALLNAHPDHDGVRSIVSLFSVNNTDYQFYESGLYGQSCFRSSFCSTHAYDEDVSCGEDWRFDQLANMVIHEPYPNYWMLCRWGLGIYHISGRGEDDQATNWKLAEQYVAPTNGTEYVLTPQFRNNYMIDIVNFLRASLPAEHLTRWEAMLHDNPWAPWLAPVTEPSGYQKSIADCGISAHT